MCIMFIKRLVCTLLCVVFCCVSTACSWNVKRFSDDYDIRQALKLLDSIGADEVFENLQENSVKIIFYDLSLINFSYSNHHAINSVDNWGDRYILINSKYRRAYKEQIACLIAHESFHKGKVATMREETLATHKEAYYWSILKIPGKYYAETPLTNRLERLAMLYKRSNENEDLIAKRIQNNKFYQDQLAISTRRRM